MAAVFDHVAARIADFKIPQYVAVSTTSPPRSPGGKLLKRRLRTGTDWARRPALTGPPLSRPLVGSQQ